MGAIILSTLEASMLTDSQPIQTQSSWQGSVFGTLFGSCELFLLPDIGLWLLPGAKNFEFLYFLLFFCQTQAASATGWSMYFFLILFSINFFYNFFCRQAASATGWSILASNLIETPPHSHRSFMQCKQNCLQIKSRNTCFKAVGITRPLPIYKSAGYVYC